MMHALVGQFPCGIARFLSIHRSSRRVLPPSASHLIHRLLRRGCAALMLTGMAAALPTSVYAQEFLSIKGNTVNVRAKPNTQADVAWELISGYPVQVMEVQDDWVKVKDFEGPLGWVHKPRTSSEPHYLVKSETVNLREGPSTTHGVVTKLKKYDIVKTVDKQGEWVKIKTSEGQEGWMLEKLAWGW
jgi:SH3-like domain-containing protein